MRTEPRVLTVLALLLPVLLLPAEAGAQVGRTSASGSTVRTILVPRSRVEVRSQQYGQMTAILTEEGDRVRAGQSLARLDDEPHRLARDRALAEAARALAVYLRNREGFKEGSAVRVVSRIELEVSEAEYRMAQADSALKEMELDRTRLRTPIAGRVVERRVQSGEWVAPQQHLFTVADLSVLKAVFVVPYAEAAGLEAGSTVRLTVDPVGAAMEVEGTLTLRSPVVDPASGGVKVTVEIANGSGRITSGLPVAMKVGM